MLLVDCWTHDFRDFLKAAKRSVEAPKSCELSMNSKFESSMTYKMHTRFLHAL